MQEETRVSGETHKVEPGLATKLTFRTSENEIHSAVMKSKLINHYTSPTSNSLPGVSTELMDKSRISIWNL